MRKLTVITATAPSAWASYLINGDASGIEPHEEAAADAFCEWANSGADNISPVDCTDAGFIAYPDAYHFYPYGADCAVYTFLR